MISGPGQGGQTGRMHEQVLGGEEVVRLAARRGYNKLT